jgi:hypothetical protein
MAFPMRYAGGLSFQPGESMRSALLLLLVIGTAAPAVAQQAKPVQPNQPSQPAQPSKSSKPSSPEEIMRQRILLRERFNKGWDIQPESAQERQRRCKAEAKKHYSAFHPFKRRKFAKECMARAGR